MSIKISAILLIVALLAATGAYAAGRGVDLGRMVTESRCSAGAFIEHSQAPSALQADAHSDETVAISSATGQLASAAYAPVALSSPNLIANGNLEALNGANPTGWSPNSYGQNVSRTAVVAGYGGGRAVRAELSDLTDGASTWVTQPVQVTPGAYYQFQDYYRAKVVSRAEVMLKNTAGKQQFIALDTVPASDGWAVYTQRFFVPTNVAEIAITHPLDRDGWLETDNYSLVRATAPRFSQAMVSVTFDDGWRSVHDNALPLMDKYGIVSTQYLTSGFLGQLDPYMKPGDVYDFVRTRHEIASHTVDHPDLTKVDDAELTEQITVSQEGLNKCYQTVTDFAPPFGASNTRSTEAVQKVYQTSRSTSAGFNTPDTFNPYYLKVQNVRADTSADQIRAWLETARSNGAWLILVYHQVDDKGGEYARKPADFETDLKSIGDSGLAVLTVHNAYLKTQGL